MEYVSKQINVDLGVNSKRGCEWSSSKLVRSRRETTQDYKKRKNAAAGEFIYVCMYQVSYVVS